MPGRVPFEAFFGPEMDLSPTASRFDNSISWLAAVGNEAATLGGHTNVQSASSAPMARLTSRAP